MTNAITIKIKLTSLLVIFLAISYCKAQNVESIFQLINDRKLDSARLLIYKALQEYPNDSEVLYALGKVDMKAGNMSKALDSYEKVLGSKNVKRSIKGWTYHDLVICHYALGQKAEAKNFIDSCLRLSATRNVVNSVRYLSMIQGFDSVYTFWKTIETPHFVFHFQSPVINIDKFIQGKERAFNKINEFFQANLPKKIDYFVWSSDAEGTNMLKRNLAFTQPSLSLTHTSQHHTMGHEMTHTICYFSAQFTNPHRLISEGVCVYFDLSNRNNILLLKGKGTIISIVDIWENNITANDDVIYPLGGELTKRLITRFGRDKFLQLLSDQSYHNAKKIYGQDLDGVIQAIEKELNN